SIDGARMATCPECEFDEIDTEDLEEGDRLSCPECGKRLVMVGSDELDVADEDDDDLDDDDLEEDEDEEDDDDDEDDLDEEDEDEEDYDGWSWTARSARDQGDTSPSSAGRLRLAHRRVQRGRRQRLSSVGSHGRPGTIRCLYYRWYPELPRSPPPACRDRCPRGRSAPRDHSHVRARSRRVQGEPHQSLLLLQARALHSVDRYCHRSRVCRGGRWQQCRRSWRLSTRPAGGAWVWGAKSPRRSRADQRGKSVVVAP